MKRVIKFCSVGVWFLWVGPSLAQPPEQPGLTEQVKDLLSRGDYLTALNLTLEALAKNPADETAWETLERAFEICVMRGQSEVLEEAFRSWAEREPQNPLAHCWLGAALAAQEEREEEAEEAYQQALKLDPRCADAHFRLAALWQRQGQEEEAQAEWRKFLELEPDSDRAWLVRRGVVVIAARNVTNTPQNPPEIRPTWSPDGKHLAFLQGWDWNIWRLNLATGEQTPVTTSGKNEGDCLDWSPDGRLILFTKEAQPKYSCLVPADGSQPERPLCEVASATPATMPCWSPDGQKVYFTKPDAFGLWVVGADGREAMPLPHREGLGSYHWSSSLSPDGQWIACSADLGPTRRDVCIFPVDNPAAHIHLTRSDRWHDVPCFSPDGRHVLFSFNEKGWFDIGIAAVDEPGREVWLFPCYHEAEWGSYPRWSPDGRRFAVNRPRFGDLWVVTLGGLDPRPLKMEARPQKGGLLVSLTSRREEPRTVSLTYRLFDEDSVQVAEGPVGEPDMVLQPEEIIDCQLLLEAATRPGTYTVKLTAVTEKGERVIELVDYKKP